MQEELFGHPYAFSSIVIFSAVIIIAGMIGRYISKKFNMSPVLGEIGIGIVIGNVGLLLGGDIFFLIMHMDRMSQIVAEVWNAGLSIWDATRVVFHQNNFENNPIAVRIDAVMSGVDGAVHVVTAVTLWVFSNLGVHFLIFMVGVHSTTAEIRELGIQSILVAAVGVAAPFALGFAVTELLLPGSELSTHLFVGAALAATSISLTARIFRDMGLESSAEARVILGAAVVDDILVLIILAVIVGMVATGEMDTGEIVRVFILSIAFLGAIVVWGEQAANLGIKYCHRLDPPTFMLIYAVAVLCGLSWLAEQVGLASIVGAFSAGLILNDKSFRRLTRSRKKLGDALRPLEVFFSPIFFVLMGMQVDLTYLFGPGVLMMILVLLTVAVLGKFLAGIVVYKKADWMVIGFGMTPRGEVGLILAAAGKSLGVFSGGIFSAIVITTVLTSIVASVGLGWRLKNEELRP